MAEIGINDCLIASKKFRFCLGSLVILVSYLGENAF